MKEKGELQRKLIDIPVQTLEVIKTKAKYQKVSTKKYIEMVVEEEADKPTVYKYASKKSIKRRKLNKP